MAVWFTFDGGPQPAFTRVEIRGPVRHGDAHPGIATFSAPPALGPMLDRLIDALVD
ncbi:MAG: hypothetical protein H0V89_10145, partial [Deltaproteobacteria bacterium]|nr:hypothetical protein [Deltaproteobacteria bacterium]